MNSPTPEERVLLFSAEQDGCISLAHIPPEEIEIMRHALEEMASKKYVEREDENGNISFRLTELGKALRDALLRNRLGQP